MWDVARKPAADTGPGPDTGLYTYEAEVWTDHVVVRGTMTGPDTRLSDHVNGTASNLDLRPSTMIWHHGQAVRVSESFRANISKAHILFLIPIMEPRPVSTSWAAGRPTVRRGAWCVVGQYGIAGHLHLESGVYDPRVALRTLDQKGFIPFTDAQVTLPDGSIREYPTVIVNRPRVEVLAIPNS